MNPHHATSSRTYSDMSDTNTDTATSSANEVRMRLSSPSHPGQNSFKDINPVLQEFRENFFLMRKEISKKSPTVVDNQPRRAKTMGESNKNARLLVSDGDSRLERIMTQVKMMQDVTLPAEPQIRSKESTVKDTPTREKGVLNLDRFDCQKELDGLSRRKKDVPLEYELSVLLETMTMSVSESESGQTKSKTSESEVEKVRDECPHDLTALLSKCQTRFGDDTKLHKEDEELEEVGLLNIRGGPLLNPKKTIMNVWKSSNATKKSSKFLEQSEDFFQLQKKDKAEILAFSPSSRSSAAERDDLNMTLPTAPKQFIDPGIIVIEKQLRAWEEMVKQMRRKRKHKRYRKKGISSLFDAGVMIVKLQALGLNPSLVSRVDKATLSIVLQIRLWQKIALDGRLHRSAPTKKLLAVYEKQLATSLPVSVVRSIAVHAIDILQVCQLKYEWALGYSHPSTLDCIDRIDALALNLPTSFSLFDRKRPSIMKRLTIGTKKVYPANYEGWSSSDLEIGRRNIQFLNPPLDSSDSLISENSRKFMKFKGAKVQMKVIEESEEKLKE